MICGRLSDQIAFSLYFISIILITSASVSVGYRQHGVIVISQVAPEWASHARQRQWRGCLQRLPLLSAANLIKIPVCFVSLSLSPLCLCPLPVVRSSSRPNWPEHWRRSLVGILSFRFCSYTFPGFLAFFPICSICMAISLIV